MELKEIIPKRTQLQVFYLQSGDKTTDSMGENKALFLLFHLLDSWNSRFHSSGFNPTTGLILAP